MNAKNWITLGALLGGTAVMLGAFHAHGLSNLLESKMDSLNAEQIQMQLRLENAQPLDEMKQMLLTKRMDQFSTGVRYQFYHTFPILILGVLLYRTSSRGLQIAAGLLTLGTLLFSGCLYILVFTGIGALGHAVMIGGICQILGWAVFVIASFQLPAQLKS